MKKVLLFVLMLIAYTATVNAQCTPDVMCASLVCPDTITNLPHAQAGTAYSTTLTVVVPIDTVISGVTATIDSLMYNSITGLPAGFTATPDASRWLPTQKGCLLIAGTGTNAQAGIDTLVINTTCYGKVFGSPASLPIQLKGYHLVIDSSNGIATLTKPEFILEQNKPNPCTDRTTIEFSSTVSEVCQFSVINIIGEEVYHSSINAVTGKNTIELSTAGLPSGIYMYKLSNKNSTFTRRMNIEK